MKTAKSFNIFMRDNRSKLSNQYPFLSQDQIVSKLRLQWKKLNSAQASASSFKSESDVKQGHWTQNSKRRVRSTQFEKSHSKRTKLRELQFTSAKPIKSKHANATKPVARDIYDSPVFQFQDEDIEIDSPFLYAKDAVDTLNNWSRNADSSNNPEMVTDPRPEIDNKGKLKNRSGGSRSMFSVTKAPCDNLALSTGILKTPNKKDLKVTQTKVSFVNQKNVNIRDLYEIDNLDVDEEELHIENTKSYGAHFKTELSKNEKLSQPSLTLSKLLGPSKDEEDSAKFPSRQFEESIRPQQNRKYTKSPSKKNNGTPVRSSKRLENTPVNKSCEGFQTKPLPSPADASRGKSTPNRIPGQRNLRSTPAREKFTKFQSNPKIEGTTCNTPTRISRGKATKETLPYETNPVSKDSTSKLNIEENHEAKQSSYNSDAKKSEIAYGADDDHVDDMDHCICSDEEDDMLLRRVDPHASEVEDDEPSFAAPLMPPACLTKTEITPSRKGTGKVAKRQSVTPKKYLSRETKREFVTPKKNLSRETKRQSVTPKKNLSRETKRQSVTPKKNLSRETKRQSVTPKKYLSEEMNQSKISRRASNNSETQEAGPRQTKAQTPNTRKSSNNSQAQDICQTKDELPKSRKINHQQRGQQISVEVSPKLDIAVEEPERLRSVASTNRRHTATPARTTQPGGNDGSNLDADASFEDVDIGMSEEEEEEHGAFFSNVATETNAALLHALMKLKARLSSPELSLEDEDSQASPLVSSPQTQASCCDESISKVHVSAMFQDPSPPAPVTVSVITPGKRRMVMSGTGANGSNFGVMFEDQDIFL